MKEKHLDSVLEEYQLIPINSIIPNKSQPRKTFEQKALEELADSIKTQGLIQPIVVRNLSDLEKIDLSDDISYELIAGERRWRAHQILGRTEIKALIKEATVASSAAQALVENLQRKDLNPIEEAMAYKQLISTYGLSQSALADKLGKQRTHINNVLRLLTLIPAVQAYVADGTLGLWHAVPLVTVPEELQEEVAVQIISQNLSVTKARLLSESTTRRAKEAKTETKPTTIVSEDLFEGIPDQTENLPEPPKKVLIEEKPLTQEVFYTTVIVSCTSRESAIELQQALKDGDFRMFRGQSGIKFLKNLVKQPEIRKVLDLDNE